MKRHVPGERDTSPFGNRRYMIGFTDSEGAPLTGANTYRLNLPANIPAANFWSVTLYEAENASGLANGQPFPSLGSRDNPVANPDGSIDLYYGPTAPAGKEKNWRRTVPGSRAPSWRPVRYLGPCRAPSSCCSSPCSPSR